MVWNDDLLVIDYKDFFYLLIGKGLVANEPQTSHTQSFPLFSVG